MSGVKFLTTKAMKEHKVFLFFFGNFVLLVVNALLDASWATPLHFAHMVTHTPCCKVFLEGKVVGWWHTTEGFRWSFDF